MKVHAVSLDNRGDLLLRDTSCYCDACMIGEKCESWRKVPSFRAEIREQIHEESEFLDDANANAPTNYIDDEVVKYLEEDYVAALYEGQWYVGQI